VLFRSERDTSSLAFSGSTSGPGFSWATGSNGTIVLTTIIAGTYSVYYTIGADIAGSCAVNLRSNKAKVTAVVTEPTTTTTSTTTSTTTAPTTTTTTTTSTTTSTTTAPTTTSTTTSTTTAPTTTSTTTSTTTAPTTTTSTTTSTTTAPTTTTTTSTTSTTTTVVYDHYTADKYQCSTCTLVSSGLIVAFPVGQTVTINRFYPDAADLNHVYQITGTNPTGPGYVLDTSSGNYATCGDACAAL